MLLHVDHGGNALLVRPDAGPLAQSDRRIHASAGLAIDGATGRVCGDFSERGGTRQFVQSGTALKLGTRQQQQLDFHLGVGLTSAAVNHFIGVGYSFRFRAFHRVLRLPGYQWRWQSGFYIKFRLLIVPSRTKAHLSGNG